VAGKVLLEDGKGRCPFDPEYRSTAVMVGKARGPGTLARSAARGRAGWTAAGARAVPGGVCRVAAGASLWQTASSTPGLSATSRATSPPSPAARRAASPSRQRTPSAGCRVRAGTPGRGLCPPGSGGVGTGAGPGGAAMLSVPVSPDPVFVGSAYLRESLPAGNPEGDDDKVYFFFSETGKEFDYFENTIVSRIARVCKVGAGQRGCARGPCPGCRSPGGRGRGTTLRISDPRSWTPRKGTGAPGRPVWGSHGSEAPSPGLRLEPAAPTSPAGASDPSPSPLPLTRGDTRPVLLSGCVSLPLAALDAASLAPSRCHGCSAGVPGLLRGQTDRGSARRARWDSRPLGSRGGVP